MTVWVILSKDGEYVVRHSDPRVDEKKDCRGKRVFELEREPDRLWGEFVTEEGLISFSPERALLSCRPRIREAAARKIEAISPDWRQRNDIRQPTPEGEERFARVDSVREQSNLLERKILASSSAEQARALVENFEASGD